MDNFRHLPILRPLQERLNILKRRNKKNEQNIVCAGSTLCACLCLIFLLVAVSSLVPRNSIWILLMVKLLGVGTSIIFIGFAAVICILSFKSETFQSEMAEVRHQIVSQQASAERTQTSIAQTVRFLEDTRQNWNSIVKLRDEVANMFKLYNLLRCIPAPPKDHRWSNSCFVAESNNPNSIDEVSQGECERNVSNEKLKNFNQVSKATLQSAAISQNVLNPLQDSCFSSRNFSGEKESEETIPLEKSKFMQNIFNSAPKESNNPKYLFHVNRKIWDNTLIKGSSFENINHQEEYLDENLHDMFRRVDCLLFNGKEDVNDQLDAYLSLINELALKESLETSKIQQGDMTTQKYDCRYTNAGQPKATKSQERKFIPKIKNVLQQESQNQNSFKIIDPFESRESHSIGENGFDLQRDSESWGSPNFEYVVTLNRLPPESSHNLFDDLNYSMNDLRLRNVGPFDSNTKN